MPASNTNKPPKRKPLTPEKKEKRFRKMRETLAGDKIIASQRAHSVISHTLKSVNERAFGAYNNSCTDEKDHKKMRISADAVTLVSRVVIDRGSSVAAAAADSLEIAKVKRVNRVMMRRAIEQHESTAFQRRNIPASPYIKE